MFPIIFFLSSSWNNPVDTGRKLNVHKTFRRRPGLRLRGITLSVGQIICLLVILNPARLSFNETVKHTLKILQHFLEYILKFVWSFSRQWQLGTVLWNGWLKKVHLQQGPIKQISLILRADFQPVVNLTTLLN